MDLSYLFLSVPFLLALVFGLAVPAMLVLSYSRFGVGLALVFGVFMVDTMMMGEGVLSIGINLFYPDIALGMVGLVASLRLIFAPDFPQKNRFWLCFCVLVLVSLVTGLVSFGSSAGVQARPYFYFIVAGLYAMSFSMNEQRMKSVFNALTVTAFVLVLLTVYRWVVYYTPITSLLPPGGAYNIDGPIRVVYSNHALVIAQVLVGGFFFVAASSGFTVARLMSPVLLGAVLVLQHRSVWLAGLAGILVRFLLGKSKSGSASSQLFLIVVIVAVTAVPLAFNSKLSGVTEQLGSSASRALSGSDTTSERLKSWQEIVKNWYGAGVRSILIGQSFGADNTRYVKDSRGLTRKIAYTAHNFYVQTLFNTGLLGLLSFLVAARYVMVGLYRICRDGRGGAEAEVLLVLMAMQLVYFVPYGTDYLQSFILGVALAYVAGKNAVSPDAVIENRGEKAWA